MPQKWAIELSVEGDLRFLSHHDMMRAMERLVCRAKLPLKYTQGFNPRPVLSLSLPRPVGVASRAELLVVTLEEDLDEQVLLGRFNQQAPAGMNAHKAYRFTGAAPRARQVQYELPLEEDRLGAVQSRLDQLSAEQTWPFERRTVSGGSTANQQVSTQPMDLRELVRQLDISGSVLRITLAPRQDTWARPGEVLAMLGLDGRVDLSRLVRVSVDYASGN